MIILKKFIRKLYYLISFLTLMIIFIPSVKANDSYGGSINTDISTPFRLLDFDIYGNYNIPQQNSAYFFSDDFCAGPTWDNTRVYGIETQESYAGGNLYSISIYLYNSDRTIRITPAPSGSEQRRIGLGNSMNMARQSWVGNNNSVPVTYTNYSYDYFDVKLVNGTVFSGVYSVTYFFVPNQDNIALAVPFGTNSYKCGTYYFAGYKLMNLGPANNLKSSDIQSIINNSGLATASSQNEIKSSLNQVRQQVTELNNSIDNVNDTLNDDNVDGANSQVDDLLDNDNFNDSTGIQSIINAPLNFINSLSNTCSPINVTIPYIDKSLQIPCIKQELNNHIPLIVPVLSIAINGFIVYRILLDLVRIIKNSRNPDDDRIEVLDL